jgi:glycerate dehydrogenase
MKIIVLDGYTLNPGDLSWDGLKNLGEVTVYDRTAPADVVARIGDAPIILTNKVIIDRNIMQACPNLKYIGVLATGYNVVDINAAHELGITVTNIPAYSTASVAQMVFAHILNITNSIATYAHEAKDGKWTACPDFCYWNAPIVELAGKTMGIVGLGNIGMAVARIALSFGMKVLAATSKPQSILPEGITASTPQEVLANADIVSLHCPLTDNTRELINADSLKTMKHSAILINTGRGPLINEQHLADALNNGEIAAFGADVLSIEPARADNPLLKANNCFITPHIAWATTEARTRLMNIAVENVRQFTNGETVLNAL